MKKGRNSIIGILILLLLLTMAGCGKEQKDTGKDETGTAQGIDTDVLYTIGVAVFDPENPELRMFMNYYKDYLEEGFPVKFYFSDDIESVEDEDDFIRSMKEKGAQGIISFYGLDVQNTVKVCEEEELYYVLGSGTLSDEDFEAVKDNPWFLGTVGPDPAEEYRAGEEMAFHFAQQEVKSYLIITGGASSGNFMHSSRAKGILEGIQSETGFQYDGDIDTLLQNTETVVLNTGGQDISVTLCPGYVGTDEGNKNLEEALSAGSYDAVLCAQDANNILARLLEKEREQASDLKIGVVDCFSEENFQTIKAEDAFGNPQIDYVEGKYASMAGPAFAILYNAMSGHIEANSADGAAVRLYQGFWHAGSREEYAELYGYTQGIYENAYSCDDLMEVIKVFNEDTNPEALKALTEAYTVEDVKVRILNH